MTEPFDLDISVEEVDVEQILGVRTRVLRPGNEAGELARWPLDSEPTTHHFAVIAAGDNVVGCVTYQLADYPYEDSPWNAVQLRGMAVDPSMQNRGVGARLIEASVARLPLLYPDARRIWCNARERAQSFYERAGFVAEGDYFDKPGIGRHVVMWRKMPVLIA